MWTYTNDIDEVKNHPEQVDELRNHVQIIYEHLREYFENEVFDFVKSTYNKDLNYCKIKMPPDNDLFLLIEYNNDEFTSTIFAVSQIQVSEEKYKPFIKKINEAITEEFNRYNIDYHYNPMMERLLKANSHLYFEI